MPAEPLPKQLEIGPFRAAIYHKEQKLRDAECRKCFERGHRAAECTNEVRCRQCYKTGHKTGDPSCDLAPVGQAENDIKLSSECSTSKGTPSTESSGKTPVCTTTTTSSDGTSPDSKGEASHSGSTDQMKTPIKETAGEGRDLCQAEGRDCGSPQNRGRSLVRRQLDKGKTTTSPRSSRSGSVKRPRSKGHTPPQQHKEKHRRQHCSEHSDGHFLSSDDEDFKNIPAD